MRGRESGGWFRGGFKRRVIRVNRDGLAGRALTWVSAPAPAYVIPYAPQPVSLEVGQLDRGVLHTNTTHRQSVVA